MESKFKVGDKVTHISTASIVYTIVAVNSNLYDLRSDADYRIVSGVPEIELFKVN